MKKLITRLIAIVAMVVLAPLTVVAQDDGPNFFSHMSQAEVSSLLGKSNDMVVDSDLKILRYLADLSY